MAGVAINAAVLLALLASATVAVEHCPHNCQCVQDVQHADRLKISCRWENIPAFTRPFAQFPFNATKSLMVRCSGERPSAFSQDLFADFTNLWHLRVEGCAVPTIPTGTFNRLSSLRTLHLSHLAAREVVMTIGDDVFAGLSRLEKLIITESHVQALPARSFCPLQGLQMLNLSHNWLNQASLGFNKDDCAPGVDLVLLDLSRNRINVLRPSDLKALSTVRALSLAENRLETIDNGVFEDTINVQDLELQRNKLRDIKHLPVNVINLNLAENQLGIIPKVLSVLQHLVTLNLSRNRIDSNTPFLLDCRRLEHLDLSNNAFQKVPSGLIENATNLLSLQLDNNDIDSLDDGSFVRLTNLDQLSARGNKLVKLSKDTLLGLDNLTKLDLSGNAISEIANEAFNQLLKLLELDISSNTLLEVPFATRKLYSLIRLDLSGNKIAKAYKFLFNKLPFLRRLDISRNKLQKVEDYVFADMPRLAKLDLSDNSIDHLSAECFAKCPQLADIDLSGNFIVQLGTALTGLSQLRALNLTANLMTNIDFSQLPVGLTVLTAAHNRIDGVSNGQTAQQLRHLDIAGNQLTVLTPESLPDSLETVNVTRNTIESIEKGALTSKSRLKWIDLRHNKLTELPEEGVTVDEASVPVDIYASGNPFVCSCHLDWIKRQRSVRVVAEVVDMEEITCRHALHGNLLNLATVERTELLCPYEQLCSEDCPCCRFASCDCKNKCPLGCDCFHDAPFIVNIVRCSRLDDPDFSPKRIPMYATQIYLDRVRMPVIKSHDFLGRFRLKQLYVNHSDVETIEPQAFNELSSLEVLDLSGNRLKGITGDEFHNTPKLRHLFLNNNFLETIADKALTFLPGLQSVTLHNNRLRDLPMAIVEIAASLYSVTLGHNLFRCDCEKRFLSQQWLPSPQNRQKVFDLDHIYCIENVTAAFRNNDTTILSAFPPNVGNDIYQIPYSAFENEANKTLCRPTASGIAGSKDDVIIEQSDETNYTVVLLAGGLLVLILLAILGFVVLRKAHSAMDHRRRKYKIPPSLNSSSVGTTSTPVPLIAYDAFVTYAKEDEQFVQDEICRRLEAEDYSLCMLYRDLPSCSTPGYHIVQDDLITKMERSSCLILVLTQNFLNHEWQTVQIRTVHQWAKDQQKKLIVVLCGELQLNDLDMELGRFLRISTKIRWSDYQFWKELFTSMPSKVSDDCYAGGSSAHYSDMYGTITPSHIV